jgi:O-antigen ligase
MAPLDYYSSARDDPAAQLGDAFGVIIAFLILGLIFVTLDPFSDLSNASVLDESTGRQATTYISCFVLAVAGLIFITQRGDLLYVLAGTRPVLILFTWLLFTILYSSDPSTSAKRLTLSLVTYLLAAMLPWLTRGVHQFTNMLLISAAGVLILSYLGILLFPTLTIHQATDLVENAQVGDWRGIYGHKNETAIMMVVFFHIGWLAARIGKPFLGSAVAIAALIFLPFSGGKAALGLVFISTGLAYLVSRTQSIWSRAVIALGPLLLIGVLTVGSVLSGTARSILDLLPIDPTFTGRSDIWQFAVDGAKQNLLTGYGFEAFWHSATIEFGAGSFGEWQRMAHTSHNGYLDMALTIGLPGLGLLVVAFVIMPLRDFHLTLHTPENEELAYFFMRVWLFMLYQNMFEAFFVSRADPMWFALALALCGLRYTARFVVRA